jgi:hypothetical protein
MVSDIAVLIIPVCCWYEYYRDCRGSKIDEAKEGLAMLEKKFLTFKVLIGDLLCTLHSLPILFNESLRIPPAYIDDYCEAPLN